MCRGNYEAGHLTAPRSVVPKQAVAILDPGHPHRCCVVRGKVEDCRISLRKMFTVNRFQKVPWWLGNIADVAWVKINQIALRQI